MNLINSCALTLKKKPTTHVTVNQVEKVFSAASHKKVWDHFSKAQRKNIDIWKKQCSVSNLFVFGVFSVIFFYPERST